MSSLPPNEQPTIGPTANLRLEVHAGPLAGKGFPFSGDTLTFGRATDNDITLEDAQVSRYHAALRRQGSEIVLEDLGSTNGVLLNGERIIGPHILQPAETFTIGASLFSLTGFPAPSTVSMAPGADEGWRTYQSSSMYPYQNSKGPSNFLLWTGLLLLMILILAIAGVSFFIFSSDRNTGAVSVPSVVISSPVNGSQFPVQQQITVQATATDVNGVTRMELWVGGVKMAEAISPAASGQSPFTAVMAWTPTVEGAYSLEVRAINSKGAQSAPTVIQLNIIGSVLNPSATPTPTAFTPTPVSSGIPIGVVRTDLNVRSGPGTQYAVVGRLTANTEVEIIGQTADGSWWYIVYPPSPDGRGWIASEYAPSNNAGGVPIVDTPTPVPTETATPTGTPLPTDTPTATPVPADTSTPTPAVTDTPTPTPTNTPSLEPEISFSADPTELNAGECTTFSWKVSNVKAVYFEEEGVAGDDNGNPVTRQECPDQTRTYELRVVNLDDSTETREITIKVNAKPKAPSELAIENRLEKGFNLRWVDNTDGQAKFKLYDADDNDILAEFDKGKTEGTVDNLTCDTSYRLYLVSVNDIGESKPSNIVTDQTLQCP